MAKRRHAKNKGGRAPKKVKTANLPTGLKKFYKAVNAGMVPDPHTGKRQKHH